MFWQRKKYIDVSNYTQTVLIIGGAGYVGKAFLKTYSEDKKNVLFIIVSPHNVVSGNNIITFKGDLTKNRKGLIKQILSVVERIDIVVHAAATYAFETAGSLSEVNMKKEFEVNTFLPILVTEEIWRQHWSRFTKEENEKNGKRVIVIGSQAGEGKTLRKELITYSATKAALSVAWEYYADFLESFGVTSVFLKPGNLQQKERLITFMEKLNENIWS